MKLLTGFTLSMLIFANNNYCIAQTPKEDLLHKSNAIHWPKTHTPAQADIFAHNEIFVEAKCQAVWLALINANEWPKWYSNASNVELQKTTATQLEKNTLFQWSTFGLQVESQVNEFVPVHRLAWFGKAPNIDAYHTWYLSEQKSGCDVITEEVVKGEGAIALRQQDEGAMHKGHDLWLQQLKQYVERNR